MEFIKSLNGVINRLTEWSYKITVVKQNFGSRNPQSPLAHSDLSWCLSKQWHCIAACNKCAGPTEPQSWLLAVGRLFSYLGFPTVFLGQRLSSQKVLTLFSCLKFSSQNPVHCVQLGSKVDSWLSIWHLYLVLLFSVRGYLTSHTQNIPLPNQKQIITSPAKVFLCGVLLRSLPQSRSPLTCALQVSQTPA